MFRNLIFSFLTSRILCLIEQTAGVEQELLPCFEEKSLPTDIEEPFRVREWVPMEYIRFSDYFHELETIYYELIKISGRSGK